MGTLDIGEVTRRTGVPASKLRYYEEEGLIRSVGRNGLRRLFADDVIDRLALISLGQSVGFSLTEISSMFSVDGRPKLDRAKLEAKADEVEGTIRRLKAVRDGLRHAAACRAPSHAECPTFKRLLRAAAGGAFAPLATLPVKAATKKRGSRKGS